MPDEIAAPASAPAAAPAPAPAAPAPASEPATTAPAESPAAAPASPDHPPIPADIEAREAALVAALSRPEGAAPEPAPAAKPASPAAAAPAPFDWAKWDGQDTAIPEELRETLAPALARARELHAAEATQLQQALAREKSRLDALFGAEDPRQADFDRQIAELTSVRDSLQQRFDAVAAAMEAKAKAESDAWYAGLQKQYPAYFGDEAARDPAKVNALNSLIDAGLSDEAISDAIEVVELGDKAVEIMREALAAKAPANIAVRLAKAEGGQSRARVLSRSAQVVAGSGKATAPPSPLTTQQPTGQGREDWAIDRALARVSR